MHVLMKGIIIHTIFHSINHHCLPSQAGNVIPMYRQRIITGIIVLYGKNRVNRVCTYSQEYSRGITHFDFLSRLAYITFR